MTDIFVNLPITDLEQTRTFYTALGWEINPLFSDENAACIVVDTNIYLMLLTRDFLATFTDKTIIDTTTSVQAMTAFSRESRADVDALMEKGLAAGGTAPRGAQDYGYMYSRDLEDPDGNILEFVYMDPAAAEQGPDAFMEQQNPEG
ncbi:VOC family protein [Mycetocola zhadangensis]|uniref:VOC family protein n=1 Tax=Mycetocola zhadangensis TaxID=1164595 RepID=UPI003A4E4624